MSGWQQNRFLPAGTSPGPPAGDADRRRHPRTVIALEIRVDDGQDVRRYRTRDISHGGMFILVRGHPPPPLGSEVGVQVTGIAEMSPVVRMRVVRIDSEGFGLQVCDESAAGGTTPCAGTY